MRGSRGGVRSAPWGGPTSLLFRRRRGQPVSTLLGGQRQERFPLYIAVPLGDPEAMARYALDRRAEGIHRFQLKLGGRPSDDAERVRRVVAATHHEDIIIADANGGGGVGEGLGAGRARGGRPRGCLRRGPLPARG